MTKKAVILAISIAFLTLGEQIFGADFRRIGRSFRAMAMGDTGISSAHDNEALFYNPATMPNIQRSYADILSIQVLSPFTIGELQNATDLADDNGAEEINKLLKEDKKAGRYGFFAMSGFNKQALDRGLNFAGYFALESDQVYAKTKTDTNISSKFNVRFDRITGGGFSYPFGLGGTVVALGMKNVLRSFYEFSYSTDDFLRDIDPPKRVDAIAHNSVGYDFGILYRMPGKSRFRTSISVLNIGGLKFIDDSYNSPQEVNFGMSVGPTIGHWRTVVALDYRDIFQEGAKTSEDEKDTSIIKRTHFGIELGYFVEKKTFALLNVRAGLNQGLPTYGAEFNFLFGRTLVVGYTFFQEDIGDPGEDLKISNHIYYISIGI